jgi:hypothetical protein
MLELIEPESVGVLSLVTPPLAIVGTCPVSVEIVVLIVPLGGGGGGFDVCRIIASVAALLAELAVVSGGGVILTVVTSGCVIGGMLVSGGCVSGLVLSGGGGVELPGLGPVCGFGPCGACGP